MPGVTYLVVSAGAATPTHAPLAEWQTRQTQNLLSS